MKRKSARFPVARIKKIMRLDDDVGKVAQAAPILISKALELFLDSLVSETIAETRRKEAKKMSLQHLKTTIESIDTFDFLRELSEKISPIEVLKVVKRTRKSRARKNDPDASLKGKETLRDASPKIEHDNSNDDGEGSDDA